MVCQMLSDSYINSVFLFIVTCYTSTKFNFCVDMVSAVGKNSDFQPEGSGFNLRPGRGLNFGRLSFATPSVDRDVKPLV